MATTLDPSVGFQHEALAQSGSDYVRTRPRADPPRRGACVRENAPVSAALTIANYEFALAASDGRRSRGSLIRPRRKDVLLVDGAILVTPDDADSSTNRGTTGQESFLLDEPRRGRRGYARIAGVRVPVRVESRAWVKIAGVSTFVMTYEYEEVNGRTLAQSSAVR